MAKAAEPYSFHLVSATHWDREWYLTFQEFRLQLVDLIDHLLALMDSDPEYRHFMLDGQMITVDDYLEIRPERAAKIAELAKAGKLVVGPWYVLADEWLASPEALVRNMRIGMESSKRFGKPMMVGYLPDEFGHIAQMPQILNGFGIDCAFFMRGARPHEHGAQIWWQAPDGSRVLGHCQSYVDGGHLPDDVDQVFERFNEIKDTQSQRTKTHTLLIMNCADHQEPQPYLTKMIEAYNRKHPDKVAHSTLEEFFAELKASVGKLPTRVGELRDDLRCMNGVSLRETLSSRMFNKQANQRTEDALEKWAEPFTGIAAMMGCEHPSAQLVYAWKLLLQNHPHDSICGCSIDRVHSQMTARFEGAEEIANKLTRRAFDSILSPEPVEGSKGFILAKRDRSGITKGDIGFSVWNSSTHQRKGLVVADVDVPAEWQAADRLSLVDGKGKQVPAQVVSPAFDEEFRLTYYTLTSDLKNNPRLVAFNADVPATGYKLYALRNKPALSEAEGPGKKAEVPFKYGDNWAENDLVKFTIAPNGTITLHDKRIGKKFAGLNLIEDGGDIGGGYEFLKPEKDSIFTSEDAKADVKLTEVGPAYIRFRIEVTVQVPAGASTDRKARTARKKPLRVISYVTLGAKSKRLEFRTVVYNQSVDHRLRVCFPTNAKTDVAHAHGHFDVLERTVKSEVKPGPTEHQLRFVDLSDENGGLAVFNKGLPEYEATHDKTRAIKLTLFRSNSYVTKQWWPRLFSPEAEFIGRSEYEYAVYAHPGDWKRGGVMKEAESFCLPLFAYQPKFWGEWAALPAQAELVKVDSPAAVTSIIKKADDRDSLIARLYNPSKGKTTARISLWSPIKNAYLTNLNEECQGKLEVKDGAVAVEIWAKKVVTVELGV